MTESAPWSIFVPFYANKKGELESYLRTTIQSVLNQTYQNWTLTVVDDQSPIEGVHDLVESFRDPRIFYVRNATNKGQAGNWNVCIGLNKSPYFTILHADDVLEPQYGQVMLNIARAQKKSAVIFCGAHIINEHGKRIRTFIDTYKDLLQPSHDYELEGESGLLKLIGGNFLMCPTALYNAELLGEERFNETDYHIMPDFWMWTQLLLKGRSLWITPRKFLNYRRHSQSGTDQARKGLAMLQLERRFLKSLAPQAKALSWNRAALASQKAKYARNRALFFAAKSLLGIKVSDALKRISFAFGGDVS
jgi:glycosyltransferase involved in cell wall biosynthesis